MAADGQNCTLCKHTHTHMHECQQSGLDSIVTHSIHKNNSFTFVHNVLSFARADSKVDDVRRAFRQQERRGRVGSVDSAAHYSEKFFQFHSIECAFRAAPKTRACQMSTSVL